MKISFAKKGFDTMKVNFNDHFTVSQPRYRRINELRRDEAVYFPTGLLVYELFNYINNKACVAIPKEILDNILVVEFQKYDEMIDVNGNVYNWAYSHNSFSPKDAEIKLAKIGDGNYGTAAVDSSDWFEKKASAVNNVYFNDEIDIEASIIYNLIEIRPKTQLCTVDYLRYYFWRTSYCEGQSLPSCDTCEFYIGTTCTKKPFGHRMIECVFDLTYKQICDDTGDERFTLYPEAFRGLEMEIDIPAQHAELIASHKEYLDEQGRAFGRLELKAIFGSPIYEELKELEARVYSVLTPTEKRSNLARYTGFVRFLEEALTVFNDIKSKTHNGASSISQTTIMAFKTSCEIILNAKLRVLNLPGWRESYTFKDSIDFIKQYKRLIFSRWLTQNEMDEFFNSLNFMRIMKNKGSHTTEFIPIHEAEKIIDTACNKVIRGLIENIK